MARPSRLEGRLLAVLDRQVRRGRAGSGKTAVATAIALCALLPVAAITPGAAAPAETAAAAVPMAPDTAGRPYSYSTVVQRTYLKAGPAQVRLATETTIEATDVFLTPDRTGVTGIRAGGALLVVETGLPGHPDSAGASTRRLRITPLPGGALQHDYQVDGVNSAFDAEARAWLASFLPFFEGNPLTLRHGPRHPVRPGRAPPLQEHPSPRDGRSIGRREAERSLRPPSSCASRRRPSFSPRNAMASRPSWPAARSCRDGADGQRCHPRSRDATRARHSAPGRPSPLRLPG
jgi:hypothetical protein